MTQSTREDWVRAAATRLRAIVEYVRVVFARSLAQPEPAEVFATLLHELCHATLRQGTEHKAPSRKCEHCYATFPDEHPVYLCRLCARALGYVARGGN